MTWKQEIAGQFVFVSTTFKLVGPPGHRKRLITMDTIVNSWVSDPQLEIWPDDSVRYFLPTRSGLPHLAPLTRQLCAEIPYRYMAFSPGDVVLKSPRCLNCNEPYGLHVDGKKCLFGPTNWAEE